MEFLFTLAVVALLVALTVRLLRGSRAGRGELGGFGSGGRPADLGAQAGFVPVEDLDVRLPGPDPELTETLDAIARDHDWSPAARLLALTGDDWELRWQRVQTLAGAAAFELRQQPGEGGTWLRRWRAEAPKDAGGAEVFAEFLVRQAWLAGSGAADYRIILEEARKVCGEARLLHPGSPVPDIVELTIARGLVYRQADFEELWARTESVAPDHMGAHLAALQYACEKWHGSREDAYDFAERAAGSAPEGSLLAALPLFAVYEHLPEVNMVRGLYQSAVVTQAIAGALYAAEHARADHPMLPHVRHLLLWFLVRAERYAEAVDQAAHVDGYCGAIPWSYQENPATEYALYRALAVAGATGGQPVLGG
ncbi:hypothetical protein SRB5_50320 [Streptomyces sp. RB5]|uniref:DUF4034 domain-containing protein n=1 Tax=Streptomyces smaragdinus TaxID=2585196 RepID=A0A7K0CMZ6_9ACTN|nr:hypothetical protein [Streptomyces smaragdinus]MQY14856.1 hypothetical protein [Streptomyces smaragdinus]